MGVLISCIQATSMHFDKRKVRHLRTCSVSPYIDVCDVLIVGIHSNDEIERSKGPPVMRQEERYGLLEHIKWIDEIAYDVPYCPSLDTLKKLNADFVIHGDDIPYNSEGRCAYDEIIAADKLRIVKRTEGVSTTDIVGRLLLLTREHLDDPEVKAVAKLIQDRTDDSPRVSTLAPAITPETGSSKSVVKMLTTARRIAEFSSRRPVSETDTVVYIDGAFDLFNVGHASTLKKARELGTYLIVGIYDDETVNQLKGSNYPIMNLHERVLNVCSCKWVDDVVIGAPHEITQDMVKTLNIKTIVQGSHTRSKHSENLLSRQSELLSVTVTEVESDWPYLTTAEIAKRIAENRIKYISRNSKRDKMQQEYYQTKTHMTEQ
jgi:ethanolamine-phosphate cytidylyltransferase